MKKFYKFVLPLLFASLLFSCATTVRTSIERPAELDLNGAEDLSVLPFQSNADYLDKGIDITISVIDLFSSITTGQDHAHAKITDQIDVADELTAQVVSVFSGSRYMKLVSSSIVESAIKNHQPIPCDVYLTGNISNFQNEIKKKTETESKVIDVVEDGVKTSKTVKINVTKYYRDVSFDVSYKIIDAKTNRITASRSEHIDKTSSKYTRPSDVEKTVSVVRNDLCSIAEKIMRQIQPYYVTKTYTLVKDKTKDEQMKTANKLAKNGQIKEAQQLFANLYKTRHYPEALYNSAILLAALQKFSEAKEQLNEYIKMNPSTEAYKALADIEREIQSYDRLNRQKSERVNKSNNVSNTRKAEPAPKMQQTVEPKKTGIYTSDKYEEIEDF